MTKNKTNDDNFVLDHKAIVVLLVSFFVTSFFVKITVDVISFFFHVDVSNLPEFTVLGYILSFLPIILAFDYFVLRKNGKRLTFNLKLNSWKLYLLAFPMMFGMILISEFITSLIPVEGRFFGEWYRLYSEQIVQISENTIVVFLLVSIVAPIIEEVLFRGIIQKGLINTGVKPVNAIVIASLIFGFIHFNPWQFFGAFLLGMVLGYVYYKTESLLLPILLHAFNNTLAAVLLKFYDTESFEDLFHLPEYVILIIGIIVFSVFYYLFNKVPTPKWEVQNKN